MDNVTIVRQWLREFPEGSEFYVERDGDKFRSSLAFNLFDIPGFMIAGKFQPHFNFDRIFRVVQHADD